MTNNLLDDVKKKNNLNRGTQIKNTPNVSKEEVIDLGFATTDNALNTDLIDVNIRINQGLRNLLNALQVIGYGDSHKATVQLILDYFINSLSSDEQNKIKNSNLVFKERDIQKSKKKTNRPKN